MASDGIPAVKNVIVLICICVRNVVILFLPIIILVNERNTLGLSFGGYCKQCRTHHVLPTTDEAMKSALDLRDRMIRSGRIDIDELPIEQQNRLLSGAKNEDDKNDEISLTRLDIYDRDPRITMDLDPLLATDRLYERRGKMFGVLVCEAPRNDSITLDSTMLRSEKPPLTMRQQSDVVILKAYAGKLGGQWNLPGWAPLVGKIPEHIPKFRRISAEVSELFNEIDSLSLSRNEPRMDTEESSILAEQIKELTKRRSHLSTLGVEELRRHQVLKNFRGIRMPITDAFAKGPSKLPGGTGDCAAPKLIALAVKLGLKPTGICEIYVGATGGMSTTKRDGKFYDACEPRCMQIAGHMLCGLEVQKKTNLDKVGR